MTATQAPTPGPLSGDDRGAPGAVMDALWPILGGNHTSAELWNEIGESVAEALEPFRLAPTAPVEASGSERDEIARLIWQRFAPSSDMNEANALRGEYVLVADDILDALRPQPSGETREAAWTYCPECGSDEIGHEEGDHKQCGGCGQEWFSDLDYSDVVQKNLARLSARPAPVASGGQHSSGEGWIVGNGQDDRWRAWEPGGPVWVDDRAKATRYARREDAEAVHAEDEDALTVRPYAPVAETAGEAVAWAEAWSGPCTVGNMISNLRTLPPEMPLYTAYHISMEDRPSLLKVKRPTLSRERVEGTNIKTGDETIPYSAVIWTQPQENPYATVPASPLPEGGGQCSGITGELKSQDLDALEKLADEATPGRWMPTVGHPSGRLYGVHTPDGPIVRFNGIAKGSTAGHANAAFIAAAQPATIKALIAEVRSLQARVARWEPPMMTSTASSSCSAFLARNGKGEG